MAGFLGGALDVAAGPGTTDQGRFVAGWFVLLACLALLVNETLSDPE